MELPDTMYYRSIFVKVPDSSSSYNQIIADLDLQIIYTSILCMIQEIARELAMVLELLWEKDCMDRGKI